MVFNVYDDAHLLVLSLLGKMLHHEPINIPSANHHESGKI